MGDDALQSDRCECGYLLRGLPGPNCPECGRSIPPEPQPRFDFRWESGVSLAALLLLFALALPASGLLPHYAGRDVLDSLLQLLAAAPLAVVALVFALSGHRHARFDGPSGFSTIVVVLAVIATLYCVAWFCSTVVEAYRFDPARL